MNQLGNTEIRILNNAAKYGDVNTENLIDDLWPTSKQRHKKRVTVSDHLIALRNAGYLTCRITTFSITDAGHVAAKNASQHNRPVKMRIAK